MTRAPLPAAACAFLFLVADARAVCAYLPEVAVALAERAGAGLPPEAGWQSWWSAAAAAAIERALRSDDETPEASAIEHRFAPASGGIGALADPQGGAARVLGRAPHRAAERTTELRDAFASGRAARIAEAVARLAIAVSDLGDPFLMSSLRLPERPGVRAEFADAIAAAELGALAPRRVAVSDPLLAAEALALQSGGVRGEIERRFAMQGHKGVATLRRQRLESALGLMQALTLHAWTLSGSPALEHVGGLLRVTAWPNPAAGDLTLSFTLARPGPARVRLIDLAGRVVWLGEWTERPRGAQSLVIAEGLLPRLPGVYYVRLEGPDGQWASGRFVRP